jgi:two-component system, OmpR family, response regulator
MLVLSRRLNEKILLPGINTAIQVVAVKPGVVRLGIDAPPDVSILRAELRDRKAEWGEPPPEPEDPDCARLVCRRVQVARAGVAQLQRQLERGLTRDAAVTLEKLEEDLQMLERRLAAPASGRPRGVTGRKALLVEDNANERHLLATFLRGAGLEVATAGDGCDALDYLRRGDRPDVILLDMGLPRCDGATMVRTLRRDPTFSGLKIFAVSSHTADEYDLASGPSGVDRWFHKPIDPCDLVRNVSQELDRKPAG